MLRRGRVSTSSGKKSVSHFTALVLLDSQKRVLGLYYVGPEESAQFPPNSHRRASAGAATFQQFFRKILAPINLKSALPPPKTRNTPPPKTRNFMDMAFPAERTHFFQASIKLAQPFPAPELRTKILRTRGFSEFFLCMRAQVCVGVCVCVCIEKVQVPTWSVSLPSWRATNGGLRDGGVSKSEKTWGKKPFSCIPGALRTRAAKREKDWKRPRKRPKKGKKRPVSRKGGQTPLKPPFVICGSPTQRWFPSGFWSTRWGSSRQHHRWRFLHASKAWYCDITPRCHSAGCASLREP